MDKPCWCCSPGASGSDHLCDKCKAHGASKWTLPEGSKMEQEKHS